MIGVDQASAKRPETQNKWQKQQGGCAGNPLSQHGRLWDLHAIHLSNCIRANSDCCRIGTANFAGNRNFSGGSVSCGFTPGGQSFASRGLPQYAATTTKQQRPQIVPPKPPDGRSHVLHVPHPVLYASSSSCESWTRLPHSPLAHRARVASEQVRVSSKEKKNTRRRLTLNHCQRLCFSLQEPKPEHVGTPTRSFHLSGRRDDECRVPLTA